VGADPPIAGQELAPMDAIGKPIQDLILIINKADRTGDLERTAAVIPETIQNANMCDPFLDRHFAHS
jgi:hypothetical protein